MDRQKLLQRTTVPQVRRNGGCIDSFDSERRGTCMHVGSNIKPDADPHGTSQMPRTQGTAHINLPGIYMHGRTGVSAAAPGRFVQYQG